jgi:aspartyl protease family protein
MRLAALALLFASLTAQAVEIKLIAIMGSKAMVEVDGSRKLMQAGQSAGGAKLLNVSPDAVVFEAGGRKLSLSMDNRSIQSSGNTAEVGKKIVLPAENGHFYASLVINGIPLRGVVDTGASVLAISSAHAKQAGIDLSRAPEGAAVTAQGTVKTREAIVNHLRLGDVQLYNVQVMVIDGQFPLAPLIGMNILQRFTMQRDADHLTLIQRY